MTLPFLTTVDEALTQVDGLKSLVNPDVQLKVLSGGTSRARPSKNLAGDLTLKQLTIHTYK